MRIISGELGGLRINIPKNLPIRPTTDMAKEGVFNTLNNLINLESTNVLDLFSGSGSLGIECYSRGSKNITFVEKNKKCIKQLYSTTKSLNIRAEIILNDVFKYLRKTSKKFDLVFADPPYDFIEQDYLSLIKEIQKNILRNQESILVLEHFKKKTFSEIQGFKFLKNYGDCSFSFINQKSG